MAHSAIAAITTVSIISTSVSTRAFRRHLHLEPCIRQRGGQVLRYRGHRRWRGAGHLKALAQAARADAFYESPEPGPRACVTLLLFLAFALRKDIRRVRHRFAWRRRNRTIARNIFRAATAKG